MSYGLLITRYLDRPWSEEDRKESYQGSIQDVHSMADVTAILMQNSVTMREGLYFKAMTFKNKATEISYCEVFIWPKNVWYNAF